MKTENKWVIFLLYLFTPEDSGPYSISFNNPNDNKVLLFIGKAKLLIWVALSILSGILLGQL